ncbi:MAG: hypothetical protein ACOYXT_22560 [Bacteroidota bacterium]
MKSAKLLKTTLWANVIFFELGAAACIFLNHQWPVIMELTDGQSLIFGAELLAISALIVYTILRKNFSKPLVWTVIALNLLLLIFMVTRLAGSSSMSALAVEVVWFDILSLTILIILEVIGARTLPLTKKTIAASGL